MKRRKVDRRVQARLDAALRAAAPLTPDVEAALTTLEREAGDTIEVANALVTVRTALASVPAPATQKPVAWLIRKTEGVNAGVVVESTTVPFIAERYRGEFGYDVLPLYAASQRLSSAPTEEQPR
mgnify:CR=1 FL=1